MQLLTKADLDAFETRQGQRFARLERQIEALALLLQHHGTALGMLEALLPKLARSSQPPLEEATP